MPEARDPAIKLFGKTIPLSEDHNPEEEAGENSDPHPDPDPMPELAVDVKDICIEITDKEVRNPPVDVSEELGEGELESSSSLNNGNEDDHQTPSTQGNKLTPDAKAENDQSETDASGQEKVLKKPDKVLPCPRCNSLDTKFCYYNNYNVNQPRHFCKGCQRYWTAGGTMRNVPVGAGRRKNKHSTSHYRHIMMSSNGIPATRLDAPDSAHNQALSCGFSDPTTSLKGNGTVLKFGTEAPLCESMASVLNLGDQKINAEMTSTACGENSEEPSCASSVTASNCMGNEFTENAVHMEQNGMPGHCNGLNPMQCYPGPPFAYPWSPGWNNVAAVAAGRCSSELVFRPENGSPNLVPWNPPQMMAAPAFCAPTMPFPFMPTPYWGCVPSWPGGTWNVPWVGSNGGLSPSSSTSNNSECSGNGSPTLGKHSRDASLQGEEKREKSLWVPKTLRIDDPDDAAKSSIWATLGIKPDEPITKGGIFKAFHSKTESKVHTPDAAQALHANPAAMSRSQKFQEST